MKILWLRGSFRGRKAAPIPWREREGEGLIPRSTREVGFLRELPQIRLVRKPAFRCLEGSLGVAMSGARKANRNSMRSWRCWEGRHTT